MRFGSTAFKYESATGCLPVNEFIIGNKRWLLPDRTLIMGILNVTPDSFSDGGDNMNIEKAVESGVRMYSEGADIIDVGGESTRPGAQPVDEKEEIRRVLPVITELVRRIDIPISIDTSKPGVAEAALQAGASMVNDVTGLSHTDMAKVVACCSASLCIMHMRGTPRTMQKNTSYSNMLEEIRSYLYERIERALAAGVDERKICIDPGIGFGKNVEQNLELIRKISFFSDLRRPILIGPSRKSFIGIIAGVEKPKDRLPGTLAAVSAAVIEGASIVRVHDIAECRQAIDVAEALRGRRMESA